MFRNIKNKEPFNGAMNIIILLLVLVIGGCAAVICGEIYQYRRSQTFYRESAARVVKETDSLYIPIWVDYYKLQLEAEDMKGWLYCQGTPINYPVMQGETNHYYRSHLPDGTRNISGSLYLDCDNLLDFADDNTVIYGNNMKNGSMFGILDSFREQTFYAEHPVMYYFQNNICYRIDLIGCYIADIASDPFFLHFSDTQEKEAYMNSLYSRSFFTSDVSPGGGDKLLTLSCYYDERTCLILQGVVNQMESVQ